MRRFYLLPAGLMLLSGLTSSWNIVVHAAAAPSASPFFFVAFWRVGAFLVLLPCAFLLLHLMPAGTLALLWRGRRVFLVQQVRRLLAALCLGSWSCRQSPHTLLELVTGKSLPHCPCPFVLRHLPGSFTYRSASLMGLPSTSAWTTRTPAMPAAAIMAPLDT